MAKKIIVPTIEIGVGGGGKAFGGVIYSADATVGYNAEPTKLNINVALDTKLSRGARDFLINKNDLDLTSPVDVRIGGAPIFKNMFLYSYNVSTGANSKLLNLTYVDGSALLDRIFVGLIHEHFQVDKNKHMVPNVVEFDARCPKIEQTKVEDTVLPVCAAEGTTLHKGLKSYKYLASPTGVAGRPYQVYKQNKSVIWEGGYVVLGREEFTEVNCDVSDVSYGFEDFLNALEDKKFGWGIKIDKSRYTTTKDSNLLLRSYTGTAKDVLQNWGNDLKISYYWDFSKKKPTLAIISNADRSVDKKVEEAVLAIEKLDQGMNGSSGSSGSSGAKETSFVVNSKTEDITLDGTLSQAYSSIFTAGPKAKTKNTRKTSDVYFSCQTIEDVAASGNISGRKPQDVKISLGLGKFSKDLRDIWNARKAIAVTMDTSAKGGLANALGYFRAIGFHDVVPVTFGDTPGNTFKEYVMGMCNLTQMFQSQAGKQDNPMAEANNPGGYELFIGLYDETLKSLHNSIESEIESGYIGKHYLLGAPKSEFFEGSSDHKVSMKSETKPPSQYYSMNQHYKTPLAKFAKKVQDLRLNRLSQSEDVYVNKLFDETNKLKFNILDECNQKNKDKSLYKDSMKSGFYHFEREAHWATFQEDVDNLLSPNQLQLQSWADNGGHLIYEKDKERLKTNMLKQYVPFNADLPMLIQFIKKMPPKMKAMLAAGEATDKKVVVCIVKTGSGEGTQTVPMDPDGGTIIGNETDGQIHVRPDFKKYTVKNIKSGRVVQSKGGKRNPIEEINALKSLCDRTTSAKSDAQSKFKTKCERDFMQELCSSTNFGQADKTCGEAEAIKDSLYNLELEPDIRKITTDKHGIYSDYIELRRFNPRVRVTVGGDQGYLFQDTRAAAYSGNDDRGTVDIIYPSENPHNGMIIYNTDSTTTDLGVRKVLDPINGSRVKINKRASSVQYQTKDITQDITSVVNDENQAKLEKGEVPTDIVADVDNKQGADGSQGYTELQTLTAEKYHERIRGNISDIQIDEPRKSYSFKIFSDPAGFAALQPLLTPEKGLDSMSVNIGEEGLSLSVALSNRASADVALKEIYNKTGPIAREQGRKNSTLRSL